MARRATNRGFRVNAELTWDVVRASGFAAYGLVALSIVVGLLLSQRAQSRDHWPRFVNQEVYQYTLLLAGMFSAVHGISAWLDPFMKFHWYEVLIPFKSHYRPLWLALGIVSLYLGMAVGLSTWLRPWIGHKVWRMFHYVNYLVFVLVTLHGLEREATPARDGLWQITPARRCGGRSDPLALTAAGRRPSEAACQDYAGGFGGAHSRRCVVGGVRTTATGMESHSQRRPWVRSPDPSGLCECVHAAGAGSDFGARHVHGSTATIRCNRTRPPSPSIRDQIGDHCRPVAGTSHLRQQRQHWRRPGTLGTGQPQQLFSQPACHITIP